MNEATADTLERILPIIRRCVGLGADAELGPATRLADLTMDSVVILEMLLAVEQAFGVEIHAQDLLQADAFQSIGSLADYVQGLRGDAA